VKIKERNFIDAKFNELLINTLFHNDWTDIKDMAPEL